MITRKWSFSFCFLLFHHYCSLPILFIVQEIVRFLQSNLLNYAFYSLFNFQNRLKTLRCQIHVCCPKHKVYLSTSSCYDAAKLLSALDCNIRMLTLLCIDLMSLLLEEVQVVMSLLSRLLSTAWRLLASSLAALLVVLVSMSVVFPPSLFFTPPRCMWPMHGVIH